MSILYFRHNQEDSLLKQKCQYKLICELYEVKLITVMEKC